MIEIIQPRIVAYIGVNTFNALRKSSGFKTVDNIAMAIESSFNYLIHTLYARHLPGNWAGITETDLRIG